MVMKKSVSLCLVLFVLFFSLSGCGINNSAENGSPNIYTKENDSVKGLSQTRIASSRGFSNVYESIEEGYLAEQLTLQLMKMENVRNVRIFDYNDRLLVAVDSEAKDTRQLDEKIRMDVQNYYPNKDIIVITNRQQVDQIRLLDDGYQSGRRGEALGIQLRQFFNEMNDQYEKQFSH